MLPLREDQKSPPPALKSVNEMVGKGLITTSRQEECMALYQHANTEVVDRVFPIFCGESSQCTLERKTTGVSLKGQFR